MSKKTEILQEKIEGIAVEYADLVKKQIDAAINNENEVDLEKINEGIRMINHITESLFKLSACEKEKENTQARNLIHFGVLHDGYVIG